MDDLLQHAPVPERIALGRCRELLGDDAVQLSDEDIDDVRRHAHAMAHTLVEIFLQQQAARRD